MFWKILFYFSKKYIKIQNFTKNPKIILRKLCGHFTWSGPVGFRQPGFSWFSVILGDFRWFSAISTNFQDFCHFVWFWSQVHGFGWGRAGQATGSRTRPRQPTGRTHWGDQGCIYMDIKKNSPNHQKGDLFTKKWTQGPPPAWWLESLVHIFNAFSQGNLPSTRNIRI